MTNILMIAFDDLNDWSSVLGGYAGSVLTPNFDRLAHAGSTFANAFSATPLCNPSRSSTLTGMGPLTLGILGNDQDLFEQVDAARTLPGVLHDAGWTTVTAGKVFHDLPPAIAVDIYDEVLVPQGSGSSGEKDPDQVIPTATTVDAGIYTGDPADLNDVRIATAVSDFLRSYQPEAGAPGLLLTAGITRPHVPFIVPQEYFDLYPLDSIVLPEWLPDDLADVPGFAEYFADRASFDEILLADEWPAFVQAYLASVSFADAMLGKMLDALADSAIAEDTVVVLWSDHGYHLGEKGHAGKFTLWDEAARSHLIIAAPGNEATAGELLATPVSLLDLYPTLLDYAGVAVPDWAEGESLRTLIEAGGCPPMRGHAVTSIYGSHSIRTLAWRYTRYEDGSEELYHLETDPEAFTNLADDPSFAARKSALATRLEAQLESQPFLQNRTGLPGVVDGSTGETLLIAGTGLDTLIGGDGDNFFLIRSPDVTIVEAATGGVDTVIARSSFTLADHVEHLRYGSATFVGGEPLLVGNDGANRIRVVTGRAKVDGGGGDDTLQGEKGVDDLAGGAGDDLVEADRGDDRLDGGDGNDVLRGGGGDDLYRLSFGIDSMVERDGEGFDRIDVRAWGGLESVQVIIRTDAEGRIVGTILDQLSGRARTALSVVDGRSTIEVLVDGSSQRLLVAGSATGTRDAETLIGSGGDDSLFGADGADMARGDDGRDWLNGGDGNDTLAGGSGDDVLDGGRDDDLASYADAASGVTVSLGLAAGQAQATGGAGIDALTGFEHLLGSAFADALTGQGKGNRLEGGAGADTLTGFGGDDSLVGGAGADLLRGGVGADRFAFQMADIATGVDRIVDFAVGDFLDLTGIDANPATLRHEPLTFVPDGIGAAAGEIRVLHDGSGVRVEVAIGVAGDTLVFRVDGVTLLTASDFLI